MPKKSASKTREDDHIIVVRIRGLVDVPHRAKAIMHNIKLRKKFSYAILKNTEANKSLLRKIRDYCAYGKATPELIKKLEGVKLQPPRGGFKKPTKAHYPKGVLGENKEIIKLIEKMIPPTKK